MIPEPMSLANHHLPLQRVSSRNIIAAMQALLTRPRAPQAGYAPPARSSRNTEGPDSNCLIYLEINVGADREALSGLEPANPVNGTKSTGTPSTTSS